MAFFSRFSGEYSVWMRGILAKPVSIVWLSLILLVPFLISRVAGSVSGALLFPVCFCKAFAFSFVHYGLMVSFGDCGWLLRWLFLFSDCMMLPVLYFYWLRLLADRKTEVWRFSLVAALAGWVDYTAVAPFGWALIFLQKG